MKNRFPAPIVLCLVILLAGITAAAPKNSQSAKGEKRSPKSVSSTNADAPKEYMQKVSYAIGMDVGGRLKQQEIDLDMDWFMKGMADMFQKKEPRLSESEYMVTMKSFSMEMQDKMIKKMAERTNLMKQNERKGKAFLEENKKKKGVQVLASGLQYKVIKEGTGPKPQPSDVVKVHYKGTLIDGKVFDSSYDRGEPAVFPVMGVIPGWSEALQLMKTGSIWELYIPPQLAYAEHGAGEDIPPQSTLIFKVELISIEGNEDEILKKIEPVEKETKPEIKQEGKPSSKR
jgi:FKBP-type peptidyl-prolyl cis-trans isomerase FklB